MAKPKWDAKPITMSPVNSSNIEEVGYDTDTQTLQVKFHSGKSFQYAAVPESIHDEMLNAASVGGYFMANIRGAYPYRQI